LAVAVRSIWTAILDLVSRFTVGWAVSAVNDRQLTIKALEMALKRHFSLAKTGVERLSLTIANTSRQEPSRDTAEMSDADPVTNTFAFK
jgi:hypothetical protein